MRSLSGSVRGKLLPDIVITRCLFGDMIPSYMYHGQLERIMAGSHVGVNQPKAIGEIELSGYM
jgi:hypothetical protein